MIQIIEKVNYNVFGTGLSIPFCGLGNLAFTTPNAFGRPNTYVAVPINGTFRNLTVSCPNAHPTINVKLRVNDADTDLVTTVDTSVSLGSNTTDEVAVVAGDTVYLNITGTPHAAYVVNISIEFEGDEHWYGVYPQGQSIADESFYLSGALGNGFWVGSTSSPCNNYSIASLNGEITSLMIKSYAELTTPGTIGAGNFTAYVVKNSIVQDGTGGTVDTSISITGTADFEQSTFSLPIEVGDIIEFKVVYEGTALPFTAHWVSTSLTFTPDDPDDSYMLCGGSNDNLATDDTTYLWNRNTTTTQALAEAPVGFAGFLVRGLFIDVGNALGEGETCTGTILKNGIATAVTCTIVEGERDALIEGLEVQFDFGDYITLEITNTMQAGTNFRMHWGLAASYPGENPEEPGSITVVKVVSPVDATEFTFNTTNLTPASFTLAHDEEQEFNDLTPGSDYGVEEELVDGYTTSYTVSNGSSHTAIAVSPGESVIVTVLNVKTNVATPGSGLYILVPGKTNDTLWTDTNEGTSETVKIPDPFFRTGLIGD